MSVENWQIKCELKWIRCAAVVRWQFLFLLFCCTKTNFEIAWGEEWTRKSFNVKWIRSLKRPRTMEPKNTAVECSRICFDFYFVAVTSPSVECAERRSCTHLALVNFQSNTILVEFQVSLWKFSFNARAKKGTKTQSKCSIGIDESNKSMLKLIGWQNSIDSHSVPLLVRFSLPFSPLSVALNASDVICAQFIVSTFALTRLRQQYECDVRACACTIFFYWDLCCAKRRKLNKSKKKFNTKTVRLPVRLSMGILFFAISFCFRCDRTTTRQQLPVAHFPFR